MKCNLTEGANGVWVMSCKGSSKVTAADKCSTSKCTRPAQYFCDFPVTITEKGKQKRAPCNAGMCGDHVHPQGPNVHYCNNHKASRITF